MMLSKNFSFAEMTASEIASRKGLDNSPTGVELDNLARLAEKLEEVRKVIGKPIMINSAFRSKEVNKAVGGVSSSQHCLGCAADIRVPGMTPDQIVKAIIKSDIQYDQLIREFDSWVHISVTNMPNDTPRNQTLIIDSKGTRPYATNA
jgi:hypothetical protein